MRDDRRSQDSTLGTVSRRNDIARCAAAHILPLLGTTQNMIADVMTKATDKGTYMKMREQIMNNHVGLRVANVSGHGLHMVWNAQQAISRIANHL